MKFGPWISLLISLSLAGLSGCAGMGSWEEGGGGGGSEAERRSWNEPQPQAASNARPAQRPVDPLPQRPYGPGEYLVKQGDTLYSIAFRNQADFRDLARWNNIGSDYKIYPGQVLRLTAVMPTAPRNGQIVARGMDMEEIDSRPQALSTGPTPIPAPTPVPVPVPVPVPTSAASSLPPSGSSEVAGTPGPLATPGPAAASAAGAPVPGKVTPSWPSAGPPLTVPPASVPANTAMVPTPDGGAGIVGWRWPIDGTVVRGFNLDAGSRGLDFSGNVGQPVVAAAAGKVVYSGSALKGYGELIIIKHDEVRLSAYGYNRSRLVKEGDTVKAGQQIAELGIGPENKPLLHFEIRERGKPVNPVPYLPARVAER